MTTVKTSRILFIIVLAQFCCTSVWFAGNAIIGDLQLVFQLDKNAIGYLTSAVQAGFIIGTLVFALLTLADRFSPSLVFCLSAIASAFLNAGVLLAGGDLSLLILLRFLMGFMLAGIYPVGMKIASDYHEKSLGKALGFLVGALVLGTAFPHLVKTVSGSLPWSTVLYVTSALSLLGGLSIYFFVPDGPFRKAGQKLDLSVIFNVFKNKKFRSAALGYFGHMWELYAFWAFVPVFLATYLQNRPELNQDLSLLSFFIIGLGSIGCVVGGYISFKTGSKKVAFYALLISGIFCLISPLLMSLPFGLFIISMIVWGFFVIMDSPQFSTLIAQSAPKENIGSALTIVNSIGFLLTIFSIQLLNILKSEIAVKYLFLFLALGPIIGLISLMRRGK